MSFSDKISKKFCTATKEELLKCDHASEERKLQVTDACPICKSLDVINMIGLHRIEETKLTNWDTESNHTPFVSHALMDTIESELKKVEELHPKATSSSSSKVSLSKKIYASVLCLHQKSKRSCKECNGKDMCEHQKLRYYCKDCGGKYICKHNRRKYECGECGGDAFCEHGRRRTRCRECKGSSICEHGKRKWYCTDCGGTSICPHGRQKYRCKDCVDAS